MTAYRLTLFVLAGPVLFLVMVVRWMRGRETIEGLRERFGALPDRPENGPTIWIHGASNGEWTAGRVLVDAIRTHFPDHNLILTANSKSGRDMITGWDIANCTAEFAPLETGTAVRRFLDRWRPAVSITLENEIWPDRIQKCRVGGIPVLFAGARLSQKSARNWSRFPGLARRTFAAIDYVAPLDLPTEQALLDLGVPPKNIGPQLNLKLSVDPRKPNPAEVSNVEKAYPRDRTFLAASTHEPEERMILNAFAGVKKNAPDIRLILAPRHPHRCDGIARMMAEMGLNFSRLSDRPRPKPEDDVFLVDQLGQMPTWYAASFITIIGGSFADKGGHTPVEPVALGSVVAYGPSMENHQTAIDVLIGANAAIRLQSQHDIETLMSHPPARSGVFKMARKARVILKELRNALSDTTAFVEEIDKLMTEKRR